MQRIMVQNKLSSFSKCASKTSRVFDTYLGRISIKPRTREHGGKGFEIVNNFNISFRFDY